MRRKLAAASAAVAVSAALVGAQAVSAAPSPANGAFANRTRAAGLKKARVAPCPADMVSIRNQYCVDRYEAAIADKNSGKLVSPYYSANPLLARRDAADWQKRRKRTGPHALRSLPLPDLPAAQRAESFSPIAVSRRGLTPSAYVDLYVARKACAAASKRLCTHVEWMTACRGAARTRQPYGEKYEPARCNVSRRLHPASVLHSPGEFGGTDPRLSTIKDDGFALLMKTGSLDDCASRWGEDAAYDMVGNLDEWVDNPRGTFLGAFYAREMPWGCDARIDIHSADYYDYSTGFRCCKDALPAKG